MELLWVEGTASSRRSLKELTNSVEVLLDSVIIQDGVVNTSLLVLEALHHLRLPLGVGVTSTDQALGTGLVPVAAVGRDEGGEMSVCWVERNTVIAVPAVQHRLDLVGRDGGDDGPGRLCVVSLARCVLVQTSVVHHTAGGPVRLGSDHHSGAPGDRIVDRDSLQDSQTNISVQTVLHLLLPVERNLTGRVNCNR